MEYDLRRLYQVKTEKLLDPLLNFVHFIKQFPDNDYMLRHLEKHNAQAMVYVKSNDTRYDFDLIIRLTTYKFTNFCLWSSTNTIRLSDIYKSNQVDTSNIDKIPWNPIDDTVCTLIHTKSGVMPCAFPHWSRKNKKQKAAPSNDREQLVQRAVEKDQRKAAAISKIADLKLKRKKETRSLKRKHKAKKIKTSIAKQSKLKLEGESLDPNELFDKQGNIHIRIFGGLINPTKPITEDNSKQPTEDNISPKKDDSISSSDEFMCFDTYCRDAAIVSNDDLD